MKGDAMTRLEDLRDRLGMSGGSVTGQNRHCLLEVVDIWDHFPEWIERIRSIPLWFIREACHGIIGLGINARTAKSLVDFLEHRKENLGKLILDNRNEFPQIKPTDWPLFL
jgi:hypothetical protein